jgi:hypothetical protein
MHTKKSFLPNLLLIVGLGILLCAEAYFGYRLKQLSDSQQLLKKDYSMANNITFGVFSVDQWREKIIAVVEGQVRDFSLTKKQQRELQQQVEVQLNGLVNQAAREINKPQKSLVGKLKKFAFNNFVDTKKIKAQVPVFARTIIVAVNSPASKKRLKSIVSDKIDQLEKQTYDSTEAFSDAVTKHVYQKYKVTNVKQFDTVIVSKLTAIKKLSNYYTYAMLACVAAALVLWLLLRKKVQLHSTLFVMSLLFALVLLAVGTTASIIEVDARLKTLNFELLGEKIAFENQVLFFQSKSVWETIQTLIAQPKPDSVVVGALLLLFVIILPVLRITARGIYMLGGKKTTQNKVVNYLAFDSGKWDMADVMVVGILMTYIGLNGILKSQLSNLNMKTDLLEAITSNDTSLQPGFFIFTGYVVFAFTLSYILKKITIATKPDPVEEEGL